jgi:hypothetical protein
MALFNPWVPFLGFRYLQRSGMGQNIFGVEALLEPIWNQLELPSQEHHTVLNRRVQP